MRLQAFILACLWLGSTGHAEPAFVSSPAAEYDYIVVGGGTAGTALATRLSQSLSDHNILLIEAGPAQLNNANINVPGLKGSTLSGPLDWNFTTVAQAGANGRVMPVNRGKVLGGSSALNLMTWDRSSVAEYNAWEQVGNPGWNWDNMLSAMLKVENFTRNDKLYGEAGVGDSGPVQTVINRAVPEHQKFWVPTMEQLGVQHNLESLGGNPLGVMYQPSNVDARNYTRSYSANAYLPQANNNLDVLLDTRVAKVNFASNSTSKSNITATGVTLEDGTTISTRREVIISAGSIQSPGLLELSGIGQRSILSAANISQILDLPGVGENLQDHLRFQVSHTLKSNYTSVDILKYNTTYAAAQMAFWEAGEPSLYDYTGSGYAFLNWAQAAGNATSSQILLLGEQAVANSTSVAERTRLTHLSNPSVPQVEVVFSDGYTGYRGYPGVNEPLYGSDMFTLLGVILQPLSRGSVHINSSDITTKPIVDPNYLSNAHDVRAAVELVKFLRRIGETEPLKSAWELEYEPGQLVQTDKEVEQYVRSTVLSIYHPSGTCAMLPREDGGVVDGELRVWGTRNLRVVDASVVPILLSAHIQTAVYGIAERAADMIVTDANK